MFDIIHVHVVVYFVLSVSISSIAFSCDIVLAMKNNRGDNGIHWKMAVCILTSGKHCPPFSNEEVYYLLKDFE